MQGGSARSADLRLAFQAFMARAGASRRPVVAVSGGADSLCLAMLSRDWGDPLALIVDHGLRPDSSDEAGTTARRLSVLGIPARILTLRDLAPGAGLAARARAARYASLSAAVRAAGRVDLLLGHHLRDQAETVLMRERAGSVASGLAGMAAIVETADMRLLRPLLAVAPGALRAHLRQEGVAWAEDPSNQDMAALRARLRAEIDDPEGDGVRVRALAADAFAHAERRAAQDQLCAAELADRAMVFPEGYALISPGPFSPAALGALIRTVSGSAYMAPSASLRRLASCPTQAVLQGVRLTAAGKLGAGLLLVRELQAMAPPVPARAGTVWDGRFLVGHDAGAGGMIGSVGNDASRLRRHTSLPSVVLRTLPALRVAGVLVEVPHIGYRVASGSARMAVSFAPAMPASGAPFGVVSSGDAEREVHPHLQG
jgi:tRNA(Ile)-lysidine synthase